jgi:threonine dehydrogenase-like Zn-dependent dehydrogenase
MKTRRPYLVEPKRFEMREIDIAPAPDELLVKIAATGLCNWELNHWKGSLGRRPMPLGHEWAGDVVDMGGEVTGFSVADNVTGLPNVQDAFSDFITVRAKNCFRLAPGIEPRYAISEPLKCVTTVLRGAGPEFGDLGVVQGCGPMGLWCIQGLAGFKLWALVAVDTDEAKLALARQYGATHSINPKNVDVVEAVKDIGGGRLADFVIDGTGVGATIETAARCLKPGRGRLAMMSAYEEPTERIDFRAFVDKSLELRVVHPGWSLDQIDDLRRTVEMINRGIYRIREMISHTFPLADIQRAFETLEHKPAGFLKGLVIP